MREIDLFLVEFVWKPRRGAENFGKFEKFSGDSGGGQVVVGEKLEVNSTENIRKIILKT